MPKFLFVYRIEESLTVIFLGLLPITSKIFQFSKVAMDKWLDVIVRLVVERILSDSAHLHDCKMVFFFWKSLSEDNDFTRM